MRRRGRGDGEERGGGEYSPGNIPQSTYFLSDGIHEIKHGGQCIQRVSDTYNISGKRSKRIRRKGKEKKNKDGDR